MIRFRGATEFTLNLKLRKNFRLEKDLLSESGIKVHFHILETVSLTFIVVEREPHHLHFLYRILWQLQKNNNELTATVSV
jgi:hypothetical protein